MSGISTWNLDCFSFLSLPAASLGLLRGFSREEERHVLAWRIASSLELGGKGGEERDAWTDMEENLGFWGTFEMK